MKESQSLQPLQVCWTMVQNPCNSTLDTPIIPYKYGGYPATLAFPSSHSIRVIQIIHFLGAIKIFTNCWFLNSWLFMIAVKFIYDATKG